MAHRVETGLALASDDVFESTGAIQLSDNEDAIEEIHEAFEEEKIAPQRPR
jgi:hypothetical protein